MTRPAAAEWLQGNVIDQEDSELLGVMDRSGGTDESMEDEAQSLLKAIGWLLGRFGRPLVVCFDRLENLEGQGRIRAFEKMIDFLVDTAQAMIPITFVRGQQWEEKFRYGLDSRIVTRLEANRFQLRRLRNIKNPEPETRSTVGPTISLHDGIEHRAACRTLPDNSRLEA